MANVTSIEAMLLKKQFRWTGHVSRMEDHRLPKVILYGELSTGYRDNGVPRKRYKDTLIRSLATLITASGKYKQPIERTGDIQSTRLPLPLKSNEG